MKREIKYIVLNNKDVDKYLSPLQQLQLQAVCDEIDAGRTAAGKPAVDSVVVKEDWPMYEDTWTAIESWVDGK